MESEESSVARNEGDIPASEAVVREIAMVFGTYLEEPIGERTKEEREEKEVLYVEYENTDDKAQESQ